MTIYELIAQKIRQIEDDVIVSFRSVSHNMQAIEFGE